MFREEATCAATHEQRVDLGVRELLGNVAGGKFCVGVMFAKPARKSTQRGNQSISLPFCPRVDKLRPGRIAIGIAKIIRYLGMDCR